MSRFLGIFRARRRRRGRRGVKRRLRVETNTGAVRVLSLSLMTIISIPPRTRVTRILEPRYNNYGWWLTSQPVKRRLFKGLVTPRRKSNGERLCLRRHNDAEGENVAGSRDSPGIPIAAEAHPSDY